MDLCENSEVEKERRNMEYNNTLVITICNSFDCKEEIRNS